MSVLCISHRIEHPSYKELVSFIWTEYKSKKTKEQKIINAENIISLVKKIYQ